MMKTLLVITLSMGMFLPCVAPGGRAAELQFEQQVQEKFQLAGLLDFLSGTPADDYKRRVDQFYKNQELVQRLILEDRRRELTEEKAREQREMSEKRVEVVMGVPNVSPDAISQKGLEAVRKGEYAVAIKEWEPLAEQGIAEAQFNLGQMYYVGKGVPRDFRQAAMWYGMAADQGYAGGLNNLGVMFKRGENFLQNFIAAYALYSLAASQGCQEAIQNRDSIQMIMTPKQISEAQDLSNKIHNDILQKQ